MDLSQILNGFNFNREIKFDRDLRKYACYNCKLKMQNCFVKKIIDSIDVEYIFDISLFFSPCLPIL